jgi:hypothetical protein
VNAARSSLAAVACLAASAVAGCQPAVRGRVRTSTGDVIETTVGPLQATALQRAQRELRCPFADLTVERLGAGGYRVEGCAQTITYLCIARGEDVLCSTDEHTGRASVGGERAPEAEGEVTAELRSSPPQAAPRASRLSPEVAARAVIDARAEALMACVPDALLPMQISWSTSGALDALLRGDHAGGAAEVCVRAIVQRLSIPSPPAAGSIAHTIARAR